VCVSADQYLDCVHTKFICMRAVCSYLLHKHSSAHPARWLAATWHHN